MSDVSFIGQAALGVGTAVQLKTLFTGLKGGNSYVLKTVSGTITVGTDNTVTASSGWPLTEPLSVAGQTARNLWVIGGAADRIAVAVVA